MAPERPIEVKRAVALMWTTLVIGIALLIPEWTEMPPELKEYEVLFWASMGIAYAIPATLIFFVSRRRNWARILLLLFTLAGTAIYLAMWNEEPTEPLWSTVSTVSLMVLELVALYWLFSRPASQWFRPGKGQPGAV